MIENESHRGKVKQQTESREEKKAVAGILWLAEEW